MGVSAEAGVFLVPSQVEWIRSDRQEAEQTWTSLWRDPLVGAKASSRVSRVKACEIDDLTEWPARSRTLRRAHE